MLRWQERVCNHKRIDSHVIDDCHAFFTCCFHLKDWLDADKKVPREIRDKVEDYLESDLWLRLCADLANGSKHMVLNKSRRFKEDSRVEPLLVPPSLLPVGAVLVVRVGTRRYPIDQVVEGSVNAWKDFLREHGLADP